MFQTYVGEANDPWSCLHSVREQFPGANGATFPAAQVCTPVSDGSTARPSGRTLTTRSRVGPQGAPDGETANGGVRTCRECYAEFGMEEADGCALFANGSFLAATNYCCWMFRRRSLEWTTCKMEAANLHTTNHNPATPGGGR